MTILQESFVKNKCKRDSQNFGHLAKKLRRGCQIYIQQVQKNLTGEKKCRIQ